MGKAFYTAAKERSEEQEDQNKELGKPITFTIDKVEYAAYRPTEDQITLFTAAFGRDSTGADRTEGLVNFLHDTLDPASYQRIIARIRDRDDDYGFVQAYELLEWLMEEFTAFSSEGSSSSTTGPKPTGTRSTGRVAGKGSTRSTSARGASAI